MSTEEPSTRSSRSLSDLKRAREVAIAFDDPAGFAEFASGGRWKPHPHARLLAKKFRETIEKPRGRCIVELPPQHGKSTTISQYGASWYLGRNPDARVILASYETGYAESWGRKVRETLDEFGREVFKISIDRSSFAAGRWDVAGRQGGMVATGLGASITGRRADLVIVDDAVKNDEEAQSEVDREKKYQGYLTVVLTRLSERGSVFVVMTRWHESDLIGLLERDMAQGTGEKFEIVRLPAIAEEEESWDLGDGETWTRKPGDALCPALFSRETLESRRNAMGDHVWSRLYQQRPYAKSGEMFKVDVLRKNKLSKLPPLNASFSVRAWDLAATAKKTSKRTSGLKLTKDDHDRYYVEHVVLGKWKPDDRNAIMRATADRDRVKVLMEHEGGSAGEDQVLHIGRLLAGHAFEAIKPGVDKVARADAVASQVNVGNVVLIDDGTWDVEAFLAELQAFPQGTYSDEVDSLSLAFNFLAKKLVSREKPDDRSKPRPEVYHQEVERMVGLPPQDWRDQLGRF